MHFIRYWGYKVINDMVLTLFSLWESDSEYLEREPHLL